MLLGSLSLTALALTLATPAQAISGFTGPYDVSNWTTSAPLPFGGSVNTGGAPNSISLISGTSDASPGNVDFTVAAVADGTVSFDWNFTLTGGLPLSTPFGYLLNGSFTKLTNDFGNTSQNGNASFAVLAGDIFGFRANKSNDAASGFSTTTITNFSAPATPVPEPLTLLGASAAVAFGSAFKRAQAKASEFVSKK